MKRLPLLLLLLAVCAAPALASDPPLVERGFSPDKIYQMSNVDSVNVFNGNLMINIPIGPARPVDGTLAWSLNLAYNSKVWDSRQVTFFPFYTEVIPNRFSNAGMGWVLTLGKLVGKTNNAAGATLYRYQSSDGAEHDFSVGPGISGDGCDGTHVCAPPDIVGWSGMGEGTRNRVRLHITGNVTIDFPNGISQEFEMVPGSNHEKFRLVSMHDGLTNGLLWRNEVKIEYPIDTATRPNPEVPSQCIPHSTLWKISDKHGRKTWVCFRNLDYPESYYDGDVVDKVVIDAPPDPDTGAARQGVYSFYYGPPGAEVVQVGRGNGDTNPHNSETVGVPLLRSVTRPDGTAFTMSHDTGQSLDADKVLSLRLPTGARIKYDYQFYATPTDACTPLSWVTLSPGIRSRQFLDPSGADLGTTTYTTEQIGTATTQWCDTGTPVPHAAPQPPEELRNTVTNAAGEKMVHHFSVWPQQDPAKPDRGFTNAEFALPFTHLQTEPSPAGVYTRYLSTELFDRNGVLQQSTYVRYALNGAPGSGSCAVLSQCLGGDRIPISTRTVFETDGQKSVYTDNERYDGLGNFRKTTTGGDFQTPAVSLVKETDFNPGGPDVVWDAQGNILNSYHYPAVNEPWMLHGYTTMKTTQGTQTIVSKACVDPASGIVTAVRTLLGATPQDHDLLTVNELDPATNNAVSAHFYGGDRQPVGDNRDDLCTVQPSNEQFRIDRTFAGGSVATSRYFDLQAGHPVPFFSQKADIEPISGVVKASYDASDVKTNFGYDIGGRLTRFAPRDSAPTTVVYHDAVGDGSSFVAPSADVSTVDTQTGAGTLAHRYEFDSLGRLVVEKALMSDGTWSGQRTTFDLLGRKDTQSELVALSADGSVPSGAPFTKYENYDALGRVGKVTGPDQKSATVVYTGTRALDRKVDVATSAAGNTESVVHEEYDVLNRLVLVREQGGPTSAAQPIGANVDTTYAYDPAGHLIRASVAGASQPQVRTFTFDNRGFLTLEQQPELGRDGNGTVAYPEYDARGHARRKVVGARDGQLDLEFEYDAAERLTDVAALPVNDSDPAPAITHFDFGEDNATGDERLGKLVRAVRHNRLEGGPGDVVVTEALTYGGKDGRLSRKTTTVAGAAGTIQTFTQGYSYNGFGDAATITYPVTAATPGAAPTITDLHRLFRNGHLVGVEGFADRTSADGSQSGITYWPNGLLREVVHMTRVGGAAQTDDITADASGMPRPAQIDFRNYCTGPPLQADEPHNVTIVAGGSARVSVTAPAGAASYQWYTGTTGDTAHPVANSNASSIDTEPLLVNTSYWVRVTGTDGCSTDSRTAVVTVTACSTIVFDQQPIGGMLHPGASATLTALAHGPANVVITYAWFRGAPGNPGSVPVGSGTTFVTPALTQTTTYWVKASAGTCAVASDGATLSVCKLPAILQQPYSQSVPVPANGATASVSTSIVVDGTNVRIDWYEKVNNQFVLTSLSGATLTIQFTAAGSRTFRARVHDDTSQCQGSLDSVEVTLSAADCIKLVAWSGDIVVYPGGTTFPLAVRLDGVDITQPIPTNYHFRWFHGVNGERVELNTPNSSDVFGSLTQEYDAFWCEITNTDCPGTVVTMPKAYASMYNGCPLPPLTVSPLRAQLTGANPAPPTFDASCDWPRVTYQWYEGSTGDTRFPISGATHKTFTAAASLDTYWLRVTDECGVSHEDSPTLVVVNANINCSDAIVVTLQPQPVNIAAGQTTTLRTNATSSLNLNYYWYELNGNGTLLHTGSTYDVSPTVTTTYYARIMISCFNVTTVPATVHVKSCSGITVTQQPQSGFVNSENNTGIDLSITASAASTISYQWYVGETGDTSNPISGGTLRTIHVAPSATTSYWVRLTGPCTMDSDTAVVRYCIPPHIGSAGQNIDLQQGQSYLLGGGSNATDVQYNWHQDSATGPVISTQALFWVRPSNTTTYYLQLVGLCGDVTSGPIKLTVCQKPWIDTQPQSVNVFDGKTATLTVAATENLSTPMTYQWYQTNGAAVGTNSPTFTTPPVHGETSYYVQIRAGACSIESATATVSTCALPEVISSGSTFNVAPGQSVTFRCWPISPVTGNLFTWYFGPVGDVTHSTLVSNENPYDQLTMYSPAAGTYWATVARQDGCVSHTNAYVVNVCLPRITTQPAGDMLLHSTSPITLSVTADLATSYQWYTGEKGNTATPYTGAGSTTASIQVTPTADTHYWVRVGGSCGSVDSDEVIVTVCIPPTASQNLGAFNITRGQYAYLGVGASGTGLTYQWYQGTAHDTSMPIGGDSATMTVAPSITTSYWVRVTGTCGTADSGTAVVHVCATPVIDVQPQNVSTFSGATATLSVTASEAGTEPMHYQWYQVSGIQQLQVGTDSPTYTTPALTQDTTYWVAIMSANCYVESQQATVSICAYPQTIAAPAELQSALGASVSLNAMPNIGTSQYIWYRGASGDTSSPITNWQPWNSTSVSPVVTTQYWYQLQNGSCVSNSTTTTVNVCVPTITTQPADVLINAGTQATLTVAANTPGLTYQWYIGPSGTVTNPVSGATNATLVVSPSVETTYWVRVTSSCGRTADSDAATVSICAVPHIASFPTTFAIQRGQTTALWVSATGTNLAYQWYAGASGDTTSPIFGDSVSINVSPQYTSSYWVKVTGTCGSANSLTATVSVCVAPTITAQPQSVSIFSGGSTTLSVTASEATAEPMTYQWYRGTPGSSSVPVGTGLPTYTTPNLTTDTSYWVEVHCGVCNPVDSDAATVSICAYPQTIGGPADAQISIGQVARLFGAPSNGSNQYMWFKGPSGDTSQPQTSWQGVNYFDAYPSVTTQYWYQLRNGSCTTSSTTTTVNVCVPTITTDPADTLINPGATTTLSVVATTPGLTYQWYIGTSGTTTSPIAGATGASVSVSPAVTTSYWVRVTSSCARTVDSNTATVTVCQVPVITSIYPSTQWIARGQTASIGVNASGTNLTYQWYAGNSGNTASPIGGNSPGLSVVPQNTATYWVKVTGTCGSANSATATVQVCATPTITTQPQSVSIFSGTSTTLSVTASEATTSPMSYQWYRGASGNQSTPVGTNSSTYTTPALTADTSYWVLVSCGTCNPASSDAATVAMCLYPQTIGGPADAQISIGQVARLFGAPSNGSNQYMWFKGPSGNMTQPQTGWQGVNYMDVAPTVTTQYWYQLQNGSCTTSSTTTTVNVCVPTITTHPADTLINPGATTTLSVVATTPGLTYQWYIGTSGTTTSPIAGATGASVSVSPAATTSYWVRVTSSCARTVDSNTATVTVCQVPAITSIYPSTQWIARGQTASIGVNASGTNLTYQWYAGNSGNTASPIGGNSPGLSVAPQNTATYWVKVTGTCGSANSATATVQVCATPAITTQPQSVSIFSGTSTTLSVTASEATTSPMSYQWYRGASGNQSTPVGTNSSTYTTPALTADTSYWVLVSCGTCNPASSDAATVAMCLYPQTIGGPADVQTTVGQSVRLFAAPSNGSNQYMWFKGPSGNITQPQTGWQGVNYMDVAPTVTTQYWYQLQNGSCTTSSTTTTVSVCVPQITTNPQSVTVAGGTPTTLTVAANTAGVTYQWYIGASGTTTSPVAGGTSPTLTVSPASTTTYWARATSSCGRTVDSAAATVTICAAPLITRQPFNSSPVQRGYSSYTDVIATGSNLTYQWYYGESGDMSQPISSRTDVSLTLSTFTSVRVWVRVTGQCGAVNSQAVWLSIYPIITTQPTGSTTVGSGSTATVQISASGNPLHYTWRWGNGAAVPGATDSPTLITPPINSNTTVWCDVTSGVAQTSSWGADITICDGPYITSMPTYSNGPTCKIVQVNAGVYGGWVYDWVWYQGVRGDTTTQLQTGSYTLYVCPSGSRTYWCRIFADDGTGHPGCYTDSPAVTFP